MSTSRFIVTELGRTHMPMMWIEDLACEASGYILKKDHVWFSHSLEQGWLEEFKEEPDTSNKATLQEAISDEGSSSKSCTVKQVTVSEAIRDTIQERADLIPGDVLVEVAKVFGEGALKYSDNNWRISRLKGANGPVNHALLHLAKYDQKLPNEEKDYQTHLSHAIVNLMFELHYELNPETYNKEGK